MNPDLPPPTVSKRKLFYSGLCFWLVFGLGLFLQVFSSRLEIAHNKFVIPQRLASKGTLNPGEIVDRERKLQALSGLLVLSGSIGLALFYRRSLIESFSGPGKCVAVPASNASA